MRVLTSGASILGLVPTKSRASASSMPSIVELNRYSDLRSLRSTLSSSQTNVLTPRRFIMSFSSIKDSASARSPAIARLSSGDAAPMASLIALKASGQVHGASLPPTFIIGVSRRWVLRPSYENRALSEIHSSLTASLSLGMTRITSLLRASTRMDAPTASVTSMDSVLSSSQGRARKAYGLEVSAPTGQRSMTLPDISESKKVSSTYVPISIELPRPVVPRTGTPATSEEKRTHLVQWMQRVMMVWIRGPMFLSSTPRLVRKNRDRSPPNAMDWSWRSHSPPWSQMGQSRGWFASRNSITPSLALWTRGVSVLIFIPGISGMAHEATGLAAFSTSTRHMRQFPAMESRSW
mmetsp:Transcript_27297/g.48253  ORF Transcript_27297/g.48253 Transcript_27297/m.48253 type:complete len:351 (+) Transcript_27297:1283-2335(+)